MSLHAIERHPDYLNLRLSRAGKLASGERDLPRFDASPVPRPRGLEEQARTAPPRAKSWPGL